MNKRIKKKTTKMKMLRDVQGRSKTPAVLKKPIDETNCLEVKKWVKECEL